MARESIVATGAEFVDLICSECLNSCWDCYSCSGWLAAAAAAQNVGQRHSNNNAKEQLQLQLEQQQQQQLLTVPQRIQLQLPQRSGTKPETK